MYYTVSLGATAELTIKHSKFIAFCASVQDAEEADLFVRGIKKKYSDATHAPYAYVLGARGDQTRASDDGEPSGTSGAPILEAIKSAGLTYTAVVVVRYFGGIKLGTGGLTRAYGDSAVAALRETGKQAYEKCAVFSIACDYNAVSPVQNKLYAFSGVLLDTTYTDGALLLVAVPSERKDAFLSAVADVTSGRATVSFTEERYCPMK